MQVAIGLFEGYTALDAMGPYAVMVQMPADEVVFVAETAGPIHDDAGRLVLEAHASFDEVRDPDIIIVPGGFRTRLHARAGHPLVDWIREVHPTTQWTTSVCTGSLLLAAAGILDGLEATTNWTAFDDLRELGAVPVKERVVVLPEHRIITGAGVSAGIDMSLHLAVEVVGEWQARRIQLGLEYDPQPPFDSGSPDKAPADIVEHMRDRVKTSKAGLLQELTAER